MENQNLIFTVIRVCKSGLIRKDITEKHTFSEAKARQKTLEKIFPATEFVISVKEKIN
jgi:hypothetical protein